MGAFVKTGPGTPLAFAPTRADAIPAGLVLRNVNRTGMGVALHAKPGAAAGTTDLWLETVPMGLMLILR